MILFIYCWAALEIFLASWNLLEGDLRMAGHQLAIVLLLMAIAVLVKHLRRDQ